MPDALLHNALRRWRERAGLTQQDLAEAAGVTRQTVSALEAGRYVPSTALALRLAGVLQRSVEEIFWLDRGDEVLPAVLAGGAAPNAAQHAAAGWVEDRLVAHPLTGDAAATANALVEPRAAAATGALVPLRPLVAPEALRVVLLVAGCAPALAVAAQRFADQAGGASLKWIEATSGRALALLQQGLVHVAGLHLHDEATGEYNRPAVARAFAGRRMLCVGFARWEQGLVVAPRNPLGLRGAADLARPGLRLVQRDEGSGAQSLLERLARDAGIPQLAAAGPTARGHFDVARLIAGGAADAGIAARPAAHAFGLGFVPLAEERFDLVMPAELAADPRVERLIDLLAGERFHLELQALGGYDAAPAGEATFV